MNDNGKVIVIDGVHVYQYTETDTNGNTFTINRFPGDNAPAAPSVNHKKGKKTSRNVVTHKHYVQDEA